jgi:hypothetical protein
MSEKDWVQLENYPSLIAAELAQYKLTQHGIDSVIFDDEVASLYMSALGGVKLRVASKDLSAAQEVLKFDDALEEDVVAEEDLLTNTSVYCSRCHSKDIEVKNVDEVARGLGLLKRIRKWFGIKKTLRCRHCGNTWTV